MIKIALILRLVSLLEIVSSFAVVMSSKAQDMTLEKQIIDSISPRLEYRDASNWGNKETDLKSVIIKRRESVLCSPILPYIFFDSASLAIPDRYHSFQSYSETLGFSEDTLPDDKLLVYYDILNIIGLRMRRNPNLTIGIVGHNSNQPELNEDLILSKGRSEVVYNYLTKIWLIDSSRIRVLAPRDLPLVYANNNSKIGKEENRRVEIVVLDSMKQQENEEILPGKNYWDLLRPVCQSNNNWLSCPSLLSFYVENGLPDSLISFRAIEIRYNGNLYDMLVDSSLGFSRINYSVSSFVENWKFCEKCSLSFQLIVSSVDGVEYLSPVVKFSIDSAVQNYSVGLNDKSQITSVRLLDEIDTWDPGKLGPVDKRTIQLYVVPAIVDSSIVEIVAGRDGFGYADRNIRIAELLANRTKTIITNMTYSNWRSISAAGVWGWAGPYGDSYPEQRFYNRSVLITVYSK